jgi:hypothetical protein
MGFRDKIMDPKPWEETSLMEPDIGKFIVGNGSRYAVKNDELFF